MSTFKQYSCEWTINQLMYSVKQDSCVKVIGRDEIEKLSEDAHYPPTHKSLAGPTLTHGGEKFQLFDLASKNYLEQVVMSLKSSNFSSLLQQTIFDGLLCPIKELWQACSRCKARKPLGAVRLQFHPTYILHKYAYQFHPAFINTQISKTKRDSNPTTCSQLYSMPASPCMQSQCCISTTMLSLPHFDPVVDFSQMHWRPFKCFPGC